MRPLALHQLTALDATPLELVTLAANSGCQRIVTWVHDPVDPFPGKGWSQFFFPTITPATKSEMKSRLADTGIELANIEMFQIAEGIDVERYRPYLEMGAELGAARAVVHVHDPVESRAVDSLRQLSEMAAEYNIGVGIEFMGMIEACKTLERGVFFAKSVDMPNVGVALDFLHVIRTGATVDDILAVPAKYISYAQICDGPEMGYSDDYLAEGLNRLAPGEGVWPIKDLIEAIPYDVAMDIEIPLTDAKDKGVPVEERVHRAVSAARKYVEEARPSR